MTFRRAATVVFAGGVLLLAPSVASADITAFLGSLRTASPQTVRGASIGGTLMVVGIELEYAKSSEDVASLTPGLSTGMLSALARTPTGRIQVYGLLGAGIYRETLGGESSTNAALCIGAGVTVALAGPLGVRIDYRVFSLRNSLDTDTSTRKRIYVGVNLKF